MFKDVLKVAQPTVYKIINRLLTGKKIGHAFLLVGAKGSLKKETACFLAQSILCKEDLACEECNTCLRVKDNHYADLIWLDGSLSTIKKEDVLHIQSKFSLTPLEEAGKKIYIIEHIDRASVSALNSLLKFLEEPDNDDTVAIFTCDSLEKVLPTIVSRCQIIYFKNPDINTYMNNALALNIAPLDAYIISNIKPSVDINSVLEDEDYQTALNLVERFLNNFNDLYGVLFYFQTEIFTKDNVRNSNILIYFCDILALFFIDIHKNINLELSWYSKMLNTFSHFDNPNVILLLIEARDKCYINNFNISLILEQLFYGISKEVK